MRRPVRAVASRSRRARYGVDASGVGLMATRFAKCLGTKPRRKFDALKRLNVEGVADGEIDDSASPTEPLSQRHLGRYTPGQRNGFDKTEQPSSIGSV